MLRSFAGFRSLTAFAGLAALFAGSPASAACKLNVIGEIPVTIENGKAIIEGEVNGKPLHMAVDTGAASTSLLLSSVERLGLTPVPVHGLRFYGIGGQSTLGLTRLDTVRVGKLSAKDLEWFVVGQSGRAWGFDGLLGADFLTQTNADLELDLPHQIIRLIRPVGCSGDEVVYWGGGYNIGPLLESQQDDPAILTTVSIGGHSLEVQIDSGSTTIISGKGARKLGVPVPGLGESGAVVGGLGQSSMPVTETKFTDFAFDQEVIHNPFIPVSDLFRNDQSVELGSRIGTSVADFPDMLLGMDFLLTHRVYVARSQGKLYVSYVGGPIFTRHTPNPKPGSR